MYDNAMSPADMAAVMRNNGGDRCPGRQRLS